MTPNGISREDFFAHTLQEKKGKGETGNRSNWGLSPSKREEGAGIGESRGRKKLEIRGKKGNEMKTNI